MGKVRLLGIIHHFEVIQLSFLHATVPCFITTLCILAEYDAQSIMMLDNALQGLMKRRFVQTILTVQHQSLVIVLRIRWLLFNKPVLNRCQGHVSSDFSLIGHAGHPLHPSIQLSNRWILEQFSHFQLVTILQQSRRHLDGLNRVASQMEEVIQYTNLFDTQYRLPYRYQCPLYLITGGYIILAGIHASLRLWQRPPIHLAIRCQRQLLHLYKIRRHHVTWQFLAQGAS